MRINVKQERFKWNFNYNIFYDDKLMYHVRANRTLLPTRRRVCICDENENTVIELKEQRLGLKLLCRTPILRIFVNRFVKMKHQYTIIQDDEIIGTIETYETKKNHVTTLQFKQMIYKIYKKYTEESIKFYLFKAKQQLGVIKRSYLTKWNASEYNSEFDNDMNPLIYVIGMIYIDLTQYTDDRDEIRAKQYEYDWEYEHTNENLKLNK